MSDPLNTSDGRAPRVASHLALDFLNTVVQTEDGPRDFLTDAAAVESWLKDSGWSDVVGAGAPSGQLLRYATELRAIARALIRARIAGTAGDPTELNQVLARGEGYPELHWPGGQGAPTLKLVRKRSGAAAALAPLAESVAQLLTEPDFGVVRNCENSACSLLFLDRSKTRRRRWCDMSICGNRMKVAAFRLRQQAK